MEVFESLRLNSPIISSVESFAPDPEGLKRDIRRETERRGEEKSTLGSPDKEFTKRGEV